MSDLFEQLAAMTKPPQQAVVEEATSITGAISGKDVCRVAVDLGYLLAPSEIAKILDEYEAYAEQDPGATWDLIVEQQIDALRREEN